MWSLGCILAELLTGYPLLPGEDEGDQLSCIIELLGMPPQKLLDQSKRAKNFISSKGKYLQRKLHLLSRSLQRTRDAQFWEGKKISKNDIKYFSGSTLKGRRWDIFYCFLTLFNEQTSHGVETHEEAKGVSPGPVEKHKRCVIFFSLVGSRPENSSHDGV